MFLQELITVAIIHLLAVISPGPDFIMISRNSLIYSWKVGLYSSIGLALGNLVHITYSLIGIGLIISKSILLFTIIKFFGAFYLIYIGYKCLKSKSNQQQINNTKERYNIGKLAAIRMGFLTNVLNPKATLFFLSLFTQVIGINTPKITQILYGVEMSVMTFLWFAFVAYILSHNLIQTKFILIQHYLERAFGVILIGLGIKVMTSSLK
jgi:RhtB (resistance to homoserine/threonine) family protein